MIDGFCDKADAGLFVSAAYQTAHSVPTVNWVYDARERLLQTGLEEHPHKYIALSRAAALLFFNSRVKAAFEDGTHFKPSAPGEVIMPAQATTMRRCGNGDCRQRLALRRPYVVFIGSRTGRGNDGNADEFLRAAAGLRDEFDVVFVGGAPALEPELATAGIAPERMRVISPDDQTLAALLSGALACVEAHRAPGLGLSMLDAMACGCPLIVRSSGFIPELTDGVSVQTPAFTPPALAHCLEAVQRPDVREAMQHAGERRVKERSWQGGADELVAYLSRLLAQYQS